MGEDDRSTVTRGQYSSKPPDRHSSFRAGPVRLDAGHANKPERYVALHIGREQERGRGPSRP